LTLEYVRKGSRTVFGRTSCQTPWHLFPPIYLDETGSAYTLLVNPSGGLVGGDRLRVDLTVGPRAHVLISTPSANRVYRSLSQDAVQEVHVAVGPGGILEWMPEHTIPFAGSRYRQTIDVKLAAGSTLLLWDAIASGRMARGERWSFSVLENEIRITTMAGSEVRECFSLQPADTHRGVGMAGEWDYMASFFIVGDTVEHDVWASIETVLVEIIEKRHGHLLGGVSQPAAPGLAVKLLARTAPALTDTLSELWGAVRLGLWKLPPATLRKY
jgi:urease accessory protein